MTSAGEFAVAVIGEEFTRWQELLDLVHASFGYMQGVVDPPSSAFSLDIESLRRKARDETALVLTHGQQLAGCIFCRDEGDALYIGKLAISPNFQRSGLGSRLIAMAERLALDRGLPALELQTRIELVSNHAFFEGRGFARSGSVSHEGYDRPTWIWMRKSLAQSGS